MARFEPRSMMDQLTVMHEARLDHVVRQIKATGAQRVLDLGCGTGLLLYRLLQDNQFTSLAGLEASGTALAQARGMLAAHLQGDPHRLRLLCGSYAKPQPTLQGYELAAMVETIEHVQPNLLSCVEREVFAGMSPGAVLITTPNREYNPIFGLQPGELREEDHKFEWDRQKFRKWCQGVAARNDYSVSFGGIGELHPDHGQPTQTALFAKRAQD